MLKAHGKRVQFFIMFWISCLVPQKITPGPCIKKVLTAVPFLFSNRKSYCTVRIFFMDRRDNIDNYFICIEWILPALQHKCTIAQSIALGTAGENFLFGQTVTAYIAVLGTESAVEAVVLTIICKLNQPTQVHLLSINLLPYLVCFLKEDRIKTVLTQEPGQLVVCRYKRFITQQRAE